MSPENSKSPETGTLRAPARMAGAVLGRINRARLGFPARVFVGAGGIGDDLLCTSAFHEVKKRDPARVGMLSRFGTLFEGNPDIDFIIAPGTPRRNNLLHHGLPMTRLAYTVHDPGLDRDLPPAEHLLLAMCRAAGIRGAVDLRPWMFLSPAEHAAGRLFDRQIVIQSSSLGSVYPMKNKEWFPDRFQWVADRLLPKANIIQLGTKTDPLIRGAHDLRGKTDFRQSAAILSNSLIFAGAVGFLMHLARSVDCRSVIVYGGRETPDLTGYSANANLTGPTPCSPCWLRNDCAYNHECMNMITAESVLEAAVKQIARHGAPLEVDTATL